jgi:MFS family permease
MDELAFTATAISSVNAVGGMTVLPLSPLAGWLSDRLDRRRLIVIGSLFGLASAVILVFASALWHFWVAMALGSIAMAAGTSVAPALVIDLVPNSELERALSLNSSMGWFGGILGFAGTGLMIQPLGQRSTLAVGAGLALVSLGLSAALQWVKAGTAEKA